MEVTHTPGPWFVFDTGVCVAGPFSPTYADDPEQTTAGIAHCGMRLRQPEEAAANARHIVRCVNAHADLLAACEAVYGQLNYLRGLWGDEGITRRLCDQIEAAVVKAKGA